MSVPIPAAVAKRRNETTKEPKDSNSAHDITIISFSQETERSRKLLYVLP